MGTFVIVNPGELIKAFLLLKEVERGQLHGLFLEGQMDAFVTVPHLFVPPLLYSLPHIFIALLAYCLHVTLGRRLKGLAPRLIVRSVVEKSAPCCGLPKRPCWADSIDCRKPDLFQEQLGVRGKGGVIMMAVSMQRRYQRESWHGFLAHAACTQPMCQRARPVLVLRV